MSKRAKSKDGRKAAREQLLLHSPGGPRSIVPRVIGSAPENRLLISLPADSGGESDGAAPRWHPTLYKLPVESSEKLAGCGPALELLMPAFFWSLNNVRPSSRNLLACAISRDSFEQRTWVFWRCVHGWPVRTFSGVPRGSMASFACSASACPKPPCRATCRRQAEGQDSHGRPFFAINRSPSVATRNQEEQSDTESLSLRIWSNWSRLMRSARQIAVAFVGPYRGLGQPQPMLNARKISPRSAQRHGSVTRGACRVASAPGGSRRTLDNFPGAALPIRSAPHEARASPWPQRRTHADAPEEVLRSHNGRQVHGAKARNTTFSELADFPAQSGSRYRGHRHVRRGVCIVSAALRDDHSGPRSQEYRTHRRHRASDRSLALAPSNRSVPVGHGSALPAARSRRVVWRVLPQPSRSDGDHGGHHGATLTLAERLRRARDRFDSSRVFGSHRDLQRAPSAPRPVLVCRLLPTHPHASFARQGLPRLPPDHATQDRKGRSPSLRSAVCITVTNVSPPDSDPIAAHSSLRHGQYAVG